MAYLMTLSVTRTAQHQMVGQFVNTGLELVSKQVVAALSGYMPTGLAVP
jgi:hypothetical protein